MSNNNPNYKYEDNNIKSPFKYKFGDQIDKNNFICFMESGLPTLYSNNDNIKGNVFKFFQEIQKEIQNFIYIPLIKDNSLCELKRHIFIGALNGQIKENDYNSIMEYIFYTDEYFMEKKI